MNKYLLPFVFLISLVSNSLKSQTVDLDFTQTDGTISTYAKKGDTLFIGGNFSKVYGGDSSSTFGGLVAHNNAGVNGTWPKPNGAVSKVISDGNDGFFIGGSFSKVGDSVRNNVAHIDSSGKVTSLLSNYGTNGSISDFALRNDTLYVAGNFSIVGQYQQNRFALFDAQTKKISANVPTFNGPVYDIYPEPDGGWFVVGSFTKVGEKEQKYIARLDCEGNLLAWDPQLDSGVNIVKIHNNTAYICGWFSKVFGQSRKYLVAVDLNTGLLKSWNPAPNAPVNQIAFYNNTAIVAGGFTAIGGQNRKYLAQVSLSNGSATSWTPDPIESIHALCVWNNMLYVGGAFRYVYATNFNRLVSYDLSTGMLDRVAILGLSDDVYDIAVKDNKIYVCGKFLRSNFNTIRNGIAVFDPTTYALLPWNANLSHNAAVSSMSFVDSSLIIGGFFDSVGSNKVRCVASVNAYTAQYDFFSKNITAHEYGADFPWVYKVIVGNGKIAIGGSFTTVGGAPRNSAYSVDLKQNKLLDWHPLNVKSQIELSGNRAYLLKGFSGGTSDVFTEVDISTGKETGWTEVLSSSITTFYVNKDKLIVAEYAGKLKAFDIPSKTLLTSWNPQVSGTVYNMLGVGDTLFLCGKFGFVGGVSRRSIASININTTAVTNFSPPLINDIVSEIAMHGDTLYFAGSFNKVNGNTKNYLAAINIKTNAIVDWGTDVLDKAFTVADSKKGVYVGGLFTAIGGYKRTKLAAINTKTGAVLPLRPYINKYGLSSIAVNDSFLYISGSFDTVAGEKRTCFASLNFNSGKLESLNLLFDGTVTSLHKIGNSLFMGGGFTTINGISRKSLAELNLSSGSLTSFNVSFSNYINAITSFNNTLYVGGRFTTVAGQTRNCIAALNLNTKALTGWNANMSSSATVQCLKIHNEVLYVGGLFNTINGQTRNNVAAFDTKTGALKSWNPNTTALVRGIDGYEGIIFIAGLQVFVGGETYKGFAAVDTGLGKVLSGWEPMKFHPDYDMASVFVSDDKVYTSGVATFNPYYTYKNFFRINIKNKLETNNVSTTLNCPGTSITVPYSIRYGANGGNVFTVELSDADGCFSNPVIIGSAYQNRSGSIVAKLPSNLPAGNKYRVRVRSSNPALIADDNGQLLRISNVTLGVGFTANDTLFCETPYNVTLSDTSKIKNAVGSVSRLWKFSDGTTATSLNAAKSYLTEGSTKIQLVVSVDGCKDSLERQFHFGKSPTATINNNTPTQCFNNNLFLFSDSSDSQDSLYSRLWLTGDSMVTDTLALYSKSYTKEGKYHIGLIARRVYCSDTAYDSVYVFNSPSASFSINKEEQCVNKNNFIFTDTVSHVDSTSRLWGFSDGSNDAGVRTSKRFNTSGNYTVKLLVNTIHQCKDSSIKPVKVFLNPTASFVASDTAFCEDDSTEIIATASPNVSFLWYKDTTLLQESSSRIFVRQSGVYSLVVKTPEGCDTSTQPQQINVYQYPAKPTIQRLSFTLFSSSNKNNQWVLDGNRINGATDSFYSATSNGLYQVIVSNNMCESFSDTISIINLGNDRLYDPVKGINTYPNPIRSNVITIENDYPNALLEIYSSGGVLLKQVQLSDNLTQISLDGIPSGLILFTFKSDKGVVLGISKAIKY
ncbi:MAG: PQQ-binding-like beta-propeller repeat protein [Bacteroidetes bacterium]|nr:MAG: PQQ-binding-like beta-propeller repeat protein [Bacteroidota bacterium]